MQWKPFDWHSEGREREALALQAQIIAADEAAFTKTIERGTDTDLRTVDHAQTVGASIDRGAASRSIDRRRRASARACDSGRALDRNTELLDARFTRGCVGPRRPAPVDEPGLEVRCARRWGLPRAMMVALAVSGVRGGKRPGRVRQRRGRRRRGLRRSGRPVDGVQRGGRAEARGRRRGRHDRLDRVGPRTRSADRPAPGERFARERSGPAGRRAPGAAPRFDCPARCRQGAAASPRRAARRLAPAPTNAQGLHDQQAPPPSSWTRPSATRVLEQQIRAQDEQIAPRSTDRSRQPIDATRANARRLDQVATADAQIARGPSARKTDVRNPVAGTVLRLTRRPAKSSARQPLTRSPTSPLSRSVPASGAPLCAWDRLPR